MEKDDIQGSRSKGDSMAKKLEKTRGNAHWLANEVEKLRALNPNSEYLGALNSFESVSDGVQMVKETLDSMYEHYEVVPKRIVSQNRIQDMSILISSKRDEAIVRHESETKSTVLPKLFGLTEKELKNSEDKLDNAVNQIRKSNDSWKEIWNSALSRLDFKLKLLKNERRLKSKTAKGDFIVVNQKGYQFMIDQLYTFMKSGPEAYKQMKSDSSSIIM